MTMTVSELIEWFEDSAKGADQTAKEKDAGWWADGRREMRDEYDTGYYRGRRDAWTIAATFLRNTANGTV